MDKTSDIIFVTGGAGLVGKELLKHLLAEGYRVRALCHRAEVEIKDPRLEVVQGDLLDIVFLEEVLKDITHVFHCAGLVSYFPGDRYQLMKINVEGTANIVNASLDNPVQKFVHVSSVAAIGLADNGELINESMHWTEETNKSFYSKSKYLGELEVWRGTVEGLNAVIVNPSLIMGGDNWDTGSSAIFRSVYNEFPWYSDGVAGWVDVHDVVRAMMMLMDTEIRGERFILSAENRSYKEVLTLMAEYFGKRPPHRKVTPFLAEAVWRLEALKAWSTGKRPLLTKETARTALEKRYYDHSKILKALPGFSFTPIAETIGRTCRVLVEKCANRG